MTEALQPPGAAHAADECGALRRIGALARDGAAPADIFATVNDALACVVDADAASLLQFDAADSVSVLARHGRDPLSAAAGERQPVAETLRELRESGRATRFAPAGSRYAEAVGAPIVLDGRVWGAAITATSHPDGLADDAEARLIAHLELLATALAMAQARTEADRLVDEQAAVRRVAVLAAGGAAPELIFAAVATEAAGRLRGTRTTLTRFEEDRLHPVVVAFSGDQRLVDTPFAVAAPIIVGDRRWGTLTTSSDGPLPDGTDHRLLQFAEIAAASISSAQARDDQRQLSEAQAALLRVAGLVALGAAERELFDTVTDEAVGLIDNENATLARYEGDRTFTIVATCRGPAPVGTVVDVPADDDGILAETLRTLAPARRDADRAAPPLFGRDGVGAGSSVSVPIIVEGQLWGVLGTLTEGRRLPNDTEQRLQKFAELIAAALANSQARQRLRQLADDQSSLRRVAELVARGASLDEVFAASAVEASALLGGRPAALMRYDDDGMATLVAAHNSPVPVGMRWPSDGDTCTGQVLRTGRPHRIVGYAGSSLEDLAVQLGTGAGVGVPVIVEGRIWGVMSTTTEGPPPPVWAEDRLLEFAELAAAAIAGAANKASLTASRARVVATADETRRRLQRDVHDGAQQRLVQTLITLKLSRDADARGAAVTDLIDKALYHAERANAELRDVVHGILPASLSQGGLRAGVEAMLADLPLVVDSRIEIPRLPDETETTAYFVVAEALTNVVKHAHAQRARVAVRIDGDMLLIEVSDDGAGGADASKGTGLTGLADRVAAAEGTLTVASPPGEGTHLRAVLPAGGLEKHAAR